jgi:2',3'-cyclic-nucleotide 2'-phosphodiesterase
MKILFIGDVVGRPGRDIIRDLIPNYRRSENIDMVIANAENAAGGSGVTPSIAEELLSNGIDAITSGDHIWKKREIYDFLNTSSKITRPSNYPPGVPGKGYVIVGLPGGIKVAVMNLIGRVFMDAVECPFRKSSEDIKEIEGITPIRIVDVHAEATSEKIALGWHLDGKVSAVLGTHTHVQTADERILPGGTAFITDCGMTGPFDGVIGRMKEPILERFIKQIPTRFEMATDNVQIHGVCVEIDANTGKALGITRVQLK